MSYRGVRIMTNSNSSEPGTLNPDTNVPDTGISAFGWLIERVGRGKVWR